MLRYRSHIQPSMPPIDHLARHQLLQRIYDKMTDEERRLFVMMILQHRSTEDIIRSLTERQHHETMQAIREQKELVERMEQRLGRQNWITAIGSDVAANLFTDGLIFLARRLFK